MMPGMPSHPLHALVLDWYGVHARDLPWRRPDRTPWGVFVSEVMLQQTPVARVLPAWTAWLQRWPRPAALAADPPGEAIRMWDRLGYPRRALRLHAAAVAMVERHAGSPSARRSRKPNDGSFVESTMTRLPLTVAIAPYRRESTSP